MKEIPNVTFEDLAKYLLAQPDEKPINMANSYNDGPGCLMTQYGRDQGWDFTESSLYGYQPNTWIDKNKKIVARIEGNVFEMFHEGNVFEEEHPELDKKTCVFWKAALLDKHRPV